MYPKLEMMLVIDRNCCWLFAWHGFIEWFLAWFSTIDVEIANIFGPTNTQYKMLFCWPNYCHKLYIFIFKWIPYTKTVFIFLFIHSFTLIIPKTFYRTKKFVDDNGQFYCLFVVVVIVVELANRVCCAFLLLVNIFVWASGCWKVNFLDLFWYNECGDL